MAGGGRDLVIRQELLRRPVFDMEIDNNPEIGNINRFRFDPFCICMNVTSVVFYHMSVSYL